MNWNDAFDATDEQLGMSAATPLDDFRLLLDDFDLGALRRTRQAALDGKLIRRAFRTGDSGCLLFWLTGGLEGGIVHKRQLLAYPFTSAEVGWAARRVVRWFDYQRLTDEEIRRVLDEEIARREEWDQSGTKDVGQLMLVG